MDAVEPDASVDGFREYADQVQPEPGAVFFDVNRIMRPVEAVENSSLVGFGYTYAVISDAEQ